MKNLKKAFLAAMVALAAQSAAAIGVDTPLTWTGEVPPANSFNNGWYVEPAMGTTGLQSGELDFSYQETGEVKLVGSEVLNLVVRNEIDDTQITDFSYQLVSSDLYINAAHDNTDIAYFEVKADGVTLPTASTVARTGSDPLLVNISAVDSTQDLTFLETGDIVSYQANLSIFPTVF